jgi:hypothetical protein
MKYLFFIVAGFFIFFILPSQSYAIVFLPAIILIPIAKLVAIVIGSFSLPALGLGVVYTKLFGTPMRKVITIIILLLLVSAVGYGIYLKMENPIRPLF